LKGFGLKPVRRTKQCVYCGEQILADAVKCRYCKEFLNDDQDLPVSRHAVSRCEKKDNSSFFEDSSKDSQALPVLTAAVLPVTPSLLGLTGTVCMAVVFMALAVFLLSVSQRHLQEMHWPPQIVEVIPQISHLIGLAIAVAVVLRIIYKILRLKSIRYDLSADRIEWSRGLLGRKVDNIDMFRVIDIKMRRSFLDCLLGIGSITLFTTDETSPVFEFEKIGRPKVVYDLIKNTSLTADRKQKVVHLE
jgi:membrane protein YdbS with pleckstrin-like domain